MTQTAIYKPTFLQKILGRNYKWWYLLKYEFKRSGNHFQTFVLNTSIRAIEFLAIVYIWKINNSTAEIITYLAVGRVFSRLLNSWLDGSIAYLISKGGLTRYLLLPNNSLKVITIGDFGFNFIRQSVSAFFTLILAILIFQNDIILDFRAIILIPFLILALIIKTYYFQLLGLIAFWSKDQGNASTLIDTFRMGAGLFSGEVIPLFILFSGFFNPIFWTPFTFFLHHPMQIYLGKYSNLEIFYVFLGGIFWCIILYFLAKLVFKLGLKKNEAVGL
jgi:ABC-2 type transport system permease protein